MLSSQHLDIMELSRLAPILCPYKAINSDLPSTHIKAGFQLNDNDATHATQ